MSSDNENADLLFVFPPRDGSSFDGRSFAGGSGLLRQTPEGLAGKLVFPGYKPTSGPIELGLPPQLDRACVLARLEGSEYVTLFYPSAGKSNLKNFEALTVEVTVPYWLRGIGIDDEHEACVSAIRLYNSNLASAFGLSSLTTDLGTTSPFKVSSRMEIPPPLEWKSNAFKTVRVGLSGKINASETRLRLDLVSDAYLQLEFHKPETAPIALRLAVDISLFMSILFFSSGRATRADMQVVTNEDARPWCELSMPRQPRETHKHFLPFELPLVSADISDFGELIDNYMQEKPAFGPALKWYRTAVFEKRYLEDHFGYSVRLAEFLFKANGAPDGEAASQVEKILSLAEHDLELTEFVRKRIQPVFAPTSSLAETLRAAQQTYGSIPLVSRLDVKAVRRLRGREIHGSKTEYETADHQLMLDFRTAFIEVFRIEALVRCGADRETMIARMRDAHRFSYLFK